jgi:hypothetical protein
LEATTTDLYNNPENTDLQQQQGETKTHLHEIKTRKLAVKAL